MKQYDLVVIGGGSAGMAGALAAYHRGCRDILILERDKELGGILQQCIHNGFGLHQFKEEMTGPAYAWRYLNQIEEAGIEYKTDTMVIHMYADKRVEYVNSNEGYVIIQAKAILLAAGCRERTRGAISLPGYRPAGIWTAGTAQRYLNLEGYLVGKRVFILGSGDIGLIMARRMKLEGAEVIGVAELMPYSGGLPRNIHQCLEDFNIPLYLSHTIVDIRGRERLSGITIAEVDEKGKPIPGTEKVFEADTLLLSVGLIPENQLGEEAGIDMDPVTRGPLVNEGCETSIDGIFACGNMLHVHDLVDYVSQEGERAGAAAYAYLNGQKKSEAVSVKAEAGISYVLPQRLEWDDMSDTVTFQMRVRTPKRSAYILIERGGRQVKRIKKRYMVPAEMEKIVLKREEFSHIEGEITFRLEEV